MEDSFDLTVRFNDKEVSFPAKVVQWTYGFRIIVMVQGQEITFEPDEERDLRAIVKDEKEVSLPLIRAIGDALQQLLQ